MQQIEMAHIRDQGIDFAVFNAEARCGTDSGRASLLVELTQRARTAGLNVDKSALAYRRGAGIEFYGTPDLVRYLQQRGVPRWTHTLPA